MHCLASVERLRTRAWPAIWLAICSLLLAITEPSISAPDENVAGFDIRFAKTRLVDGVFMVDADVNFEFSQDALEAIENGIPVTIIFEMEVLRTRRFWFDESIAGLEGRYRIETRALSKTYIVRNLSSGESRTYSSFQDALEGLGRIRNFPLIDEHLIDASSAYTLRLRALLDIESLPSPMRPLAYFSSLWRLKSDWYEWPLKS
jgi:hypothetical protein